MATIGTIDIRCPNCDNRIGSKAVNKTNGGMELTCTNCHTRVRVVFTRDGGYKFKDIKYK